MCAIFALGTLFFFPSSLLLAQQNFHAFHIYINLKLKFNDLNLTIKFYIIIIKIKSFVNHQFYTYFIKNEKSQKIDLKI